MEERLQIAVHLAIVTPQWESHRWTLPYLWNLRGSKAAMQFPIKRRLDDSLADGLTQPLRYTREVKGILISLFEASTWYTHLYTHWNNNGALL
jgi:hypothetical protein